MPRGMDDAGNLIPSPVNPPRNRYPYCIVWSPLPPISWLLPFIGHTGIADSEGIIFDFAGPYTIGREHMAFGEPTRFIQLDPKKCADMDWDRAVREGCNMYSRRMHNIFCDNCHSHVAATLNSAGYNGSRGFGMVGIGVWFFFQGKFTSLQAFLRTYIPSLIIMGVILISIFAR